MYLYHVRETLVTPGLLLMQKLSCDRYLTMNTFSIVSAARFSGRTIRNYQDTSWLRTTLTLQQPLSWHHLVFLLVLPRSQPSQVQLTSCFLLCYPLLSLQCLHQAELGVNTQARNHSIDVVQWHRWCLSAVITSNMQRDRKYGACPPCTSAIAIRSPTMK